MEYKNKKIAIAGKNKIAVDALFYLIEQGVSIKDILVCVNSNDKGEHTWQPSLKKIALRLGVQVVELHDLYETENLVFFSLEYDKIIAPSNFKTKELYNIHFSALPAYKGMFTSVWPLLNGESTAGVTLHRIDKGIDTGRVVSQCLFDVSDDLNSFQLYQLFLDNSIDLFIRNFERLIHGQSNSAEQDSNGSSYYSKNTIDFSNISINFNQTAYQIKNYVRAFSFRPYQLVSIDGRKISHISITKDRSTLRPGTKKTADVISEVRSTIDYDINIWYDQLDEILLAAKNNDCDLLKHYYDRGYDLDQKNERGWNAIIVAGYNGKLEAFKVLIELGVSIHETNINGTSVLMYVMTEASKSGDLTMLKILVDLGADLNHKDYEGESLLNYAKNLNNNKVLAYLESKVSQ